MNCVCVTYLSNCLNTMEKQTSCIRVYADKKQINRCKTDLEKLDFSFSSISEVLSLTGNKVRLKILYLLDKESEMCPCDLSDILNMTVPAISQHLKKMKDAELILQNKVGQTIFYSINSKHDELLKPLFRMVVRDIANVPNASNYEN